jgi:GTP-dependent phosphoenolpyruvate carboxykinase
MDRKLYAVMRERCGVKEWLYYMDPGNRMNQTCWHWHADFSAVDSWSDKREADKIAAETVGTVVTFIESSALDDKNAEIARLKAALKIQRNEWNNELVRMEICNELGGPREAMVLARLHECDNALDYEKVGQARKELEDK